MSETVENTEPTVTATVKEDDALAKAREAEKARFLREESLRRELEETKKKLDSVKKNGWDLDLMSTKSSSTQTEMDIKAEIKSLKEQIESEKNKRSEMEELHSIVDFVNKNDKYELIRNLDDSAKFIQTARREHYSKTGKFLSLEEACDFVEEQIEKAETERFSRFSKTKKAEKLYQLKKSAEQKTPTSTQQIPRESVTKQTEQPEPISNSRQAFEAFKRKYGLA